MKNEVLFIIGFLLGAAYGDAGTAEPLNDSLSSASDSTGAFDTIAGDLSGVVVAQTKPYLVASDIYVPQGKTVIIEAGAVFLFKNFTGLHISGILMARGTKEKPIVFTSENDRDYNRKSAVDPAPFDWNGIYIHEDGVGSHFAYCAVLYSVEGITSLTKFIRLNTCLFLHNGRTNLTIEGKQFPVTEQPYEYTLLANDPSLIKVPAGILSDPQATSRKILRYSGIAAASAGGIVSLIWGSKYSASSHKFNSLSARDQDNLAHNSSALWNSTKMNNNKNLATLLTGCGIAVIGAVGIAWSFTF